MPAECWCGFCNDNFKLADLVSLLKEAYQSVAETVGEDEVVVADVLLGLLRDWLPADIYFVNNFANLRQKLFT